MPTGRFERCARKGCKRGRYLTFRYCKEDCEAFYPRHLTGVMAEAVRWEIQQAISKR